MHGWSSSVASITVLRGRNGYMDFVLNTYANPVTSAMFRRTVTTDNR